ELAQAGFTGVSNQVLGLVIALIGALVMARWSDLWRTAAAGAVIHVVAQAVLPMLDGGALTIPNLMTLGFWMSLLALFLGFAVLMAALFFVKSLFVRRGHSHAH